MTSADEPDTYELSELEQKAQDRRERLKNLRSNKTLATKEGENGAEEGLLGAIGRRSYLPVNASTVVVDEEVREIIEGTEESVKKIIDDSKNLTLGDNLDVSIIAPRKVDWDLRRGVEEKLEKLDRRTNRAINSIVRQKMMKEGNTDLAANVGAMTEQLASGD